MDANRGEKFVGLIDFRRIKYQVNKNYDKYDKEDKNNDNWLQEDSPERIEAIWNKLKEDKTDERCRIIFPVKATETHLKLVHTPKHFSLIKAMKSNKDGKKTTKSLGCNDVFFNEKSEVASHYAAGCVIEVTERVARGNLRSAFAIVSPPGNQAKMNSPMGFSLFNSVAIATEHILAQKKLGIEKVLVVDWDVYHGSDTQDALYQKNNALFFSVHRYHSGAFYPGGESGSYFMVGENEGVGYNINIPWENEGCGDNDYIAVWDEILIPVATEFGPDIVIISAGFNAGKHLTPYGYSTMLEKLIVLAKGKVVMILEGTSQNEVLAAKSAHASVKVLLGDKPVVMDSKPKLPSTTYLINKVRKHLSMHWESLVFDNSSIEASYSDNSTSDDEEKVERNDQTNDGLYGDRRQSALFGVRVNLGGTWKKATIIFRDEFILLMVAGDKKAMVYEKYSKTHKIEKSEDSKGNPIFTIEFTNMVLEFSVNSSEDMDTMVSLLKENLDEGLKFANKI